MSNPDSIDYRHLVEWGMADRLFKFERHRSYGSLTTPDGQIMELSIPEWAALAAVLHQIALNTPGIPLDKKQPLNAGKPWSKEDDSSVERDWSQEISIASIARRLGRSRGSIAARLVRLGLVQDRFEAWRRSSAPSQGVTENRHQA